MKTEQDPRWKAIQSRHHDDSFFYSVKTTGVYCRPSCAARLARPENVAFHGSLEEAEAAGFRPCKRCRPGQPDERLRQAALMERACRSLEESLQPPDLKQLAEQAGLSHFHFHRLFKSLVGMTPKQYERARRAERLRATLTQAESVTEAIFEAGYQSSSRFYERSQEILGMSPTHFKKGGENLRIRYSLRPCQLSGWLLVAATEAGICGIFLGDRPQPLLDELRRRFTQAMLSEADAELQQWVQAALALVDCNGPAAELPLDVRGTVFQQKVWEALRSIGPGETRTYAQLARQIGKPRAVRAVAAACAANPVAVAIPCHRVIRGDGSLAGYYWGGLEKKRALLEREAEKAFSQTLRTSVDA